MTYEDRFYKPQFYKPPFYEPPFYEPPPKEATMRDLARSAIRFSWAMSVLSARQAANLVSPRAGWDRSADSLDVVSHAAVGQMGETMKGFYEAGDRLQAGMVDTMSRMVSGTWTNPGKMMNETWESVGRTLNGMKDRVADSAKAEE